VGFGITAVCKQTDLLLWFDAPRIETLASCIICYQMTQHITRDDYKWREL